MNKRNKDIMLDKTKEYYKNNKDVILNILKELTKELIQELIKELIENKSLTEDKSLREDKKQKIKDYHKQY